MPPTQDPTTLPYNATFGGALYFLYHGLPPSVVSELIKLKNNGHGPDSGEVLGIYCRQNGRWSLNAVGEKIAVLMDLDQFRVLSNMDDPCDAILNKASSDALDACTACADRRILA